MDFLSAWVFLLLLRFTAVFLHAVKHFISLSGAWGPKDSNATREIWEMLRNKSRVEETGKETNVFHPHCKSVSKRKCIDWHSTQGNVCAVMPICAKVHNSIVLNTNHGVFER